MKNTIIEIKGVKLAMDFSAMTPTARERFKQSGAAIIGKRKAGETLSKVNPCLTV